MKPFKIKRCTGNTFYVDQAKWPRKGSLCTGDAFGNPCLITIYINDYSFKA